MLNYYVFLHFKIIPLLIIKNVTHMSTIYKVWTPCSISVELKAVEKQRLIQQRL